MAELPPYVRVLLDGYSEQIAPDVLTTRMDRGVPKTRRTNSRSMVTIQATFLFMRRQDTIDFDTWWDVTINRAGFFAMRDPRYGVIRQMRFVNGDIGTLTPVDSGWGVATRSVSLEYLR